MLSWSETPWVMIPASLLVLSGEMNAQTEKALSLGKLKDCDDDEDDEDESSPWRKVVPLK